MEKAKEQAAERPELLKFLLEQIFGKAKQNIDLGNAENEPLKLFIDPAFFHGTPRQADSNRPEQI